MKKALRRKGIVSLLVLFSLSISLRAGEAFAVTLTISSGRESP